MGGGLQLLQAISMVSVLSQAIVVEKARRDLGEGGRSRAGMEGHGGRVNCSTLTVHNAGSQAAKCSRDFCFSVLDRPVPPCLFPILLNSGPQPRPGPLAPGLRQLAVHLHSMET